MTEAQASREGIELTLQGYLAESRQERTGRFSPDALAWLALPPPWTGRLAQEAGFPGWSTDFLDEAEREGLCARTQPSLAGRPSWYPTEVGARLAAYLPADSVAALLDGVAAIEDQQARARILAVMTSALPPSLLPWAEQVAAALPDPAARTRALLGVAAVEPPAEAAATARLALGVAGQLEDPGDRAEALLLVAEQGRLDREGEQEFGQAFAAALPGLAYESERGSVLARAARYLPPEQVGQALRSAMALGAAECRIQALAGITERLPAERAVPLLRDEIPAIASIPTEIQRARAARTLARRLADFGATELASSAAQTLPGEGARQSALQAVAGSLASAGDPGQAAQVAAALVTDGAAPSDGPDRVASLSALAQRLAGGDRLIAAEIAERARRAASALTAAPANARALVSLVTALVQTGLEASTAGELALRSAAGISGPEDRYQLCRTLAGTLPEPLHTQAAEQALAAARCIDSPAGRVEALVDLVPQLPAEQREKTVRETLALAATEIDFSFWMPEPTRTNVLDELALRHGPTFLHQHTVRIAERVRGASRPDDPAPPAMVRWAELAGQGASSPTQAAAWLDGRLDELTGDGDSGQALAWVETGKLLVPVLGQELDSVVSVGMRRIELLYRRSLDQGHLRRFLPRQEQIDEFWRLIDGDDGAWAVHFLGPGGLGKTMLLRQVAARLAPERGMPTARVDFDHLSPDYPIARPGQLLLELLDELHSFATASNAEGFAYSFRAQVAQLHVPVAQGSNDPLARIHDPQFDEVLRTFRDFVLLLPQPVVLILDTCEELAKRRSEGSTLPPVDATFEILERLHEEIPALRVIFAGRRLLARSGRGWSVDPAAEAEGHSLLPARKDYLTLHEMRGFSHDEAASYLTAAAPRLSDEMRTAILGRSLAPASAAPVVRDASQAQDGNHRYNPFDLSLYASWAREDRSLTADTVAQGTTDPYIAIRIVRRLGRTELDRLLPAVALLGRFDRAMLRGELSGDQDRFERAYYELSSQEWIDYQPDPSLNTTFLEVDRNLRPRLLSYYRGDQNRSVLLREARDRLGPALARLVEARPLNQIGIDLADAAMRLLPAADAARLWDGVTGKIAAQCDWAWADQRTSRLLGEDGAVADPGHPARAAVVGSRISSLIHTRPEYNPAPDWREVAERADASPDPAVRTWLHSRAVAGLVAAYRLPGVELSADDLAAFWELVDRFAEVTRPLPGQLAEQLAASCCAALEALVEVAEMRGDSSLVSDVGPVERWLDHIQGLVPADLLALGTMITARVQALHGRFEAALDLAIRAERSSAAMPAGRPARWADFDAPSVICHRIRLELMRMAVAFPVPTDPVKHVPVADWQRSAEADLGTIDADRLLAAILRRHLSAGIVPRDEVVRLSELEQRAVKRVSQSPRSALWCHVAVPPLFTILAWCWHALGRGDRAFELLNARRRRALAAGDTSAENAALIATLEISRRMRIKQPVQAKNSGHADDAGQRAAAWALTALTERPQGQATDPVRTLPDAQLHDWWRTRPVLPAAESEDAKEFRRRAEQLTGHRGDLSPFAAACLGLDLAEADIAEARTPVRRPFYLPGPAVNGVTAEQLARMRLRMLALGYDFSLAVADDHPGPMEEWIGRVGRRRRAELAMDEGELLALRLPREAIVLLDLAATWFREAGDRAGALYAMIAGTLARRRAGMAVGGDDFQAMTDAYQAMARQAEPPLPDLADLVQARVTPSPQLEQAMGGWQERLRAGLGQRPVVATGRPERVPVELDPAVLTRRRRPRRVRLSGRTRPLGLIGFIIGLTGPAAVAALTVFYTGNSLASASGISSAAGVAAVLGALVAVLALLEALGARRRLTAWARAWWWARAAVGLRIAPRPGAAASGQAEVVIEEWQFNSGFLWRTSYHSTNYVALPPLRSYERGAAALPAELRGGLRKLADRVGSRRILVPLDIDPALDRLPWEALLSHPVLTGKTPLPGALDFWRRGDPPPVTGPRPPAERPRPPDLVAVLADSTRRLFAERAGLGRSLSFPDLSADHGDDVNRAIERAGSQATRAPDIVLVIGRPVRVRGAVLLQTAEQATAHGTSAGQLREAVVGGGLLEPEVVAGLRGRLFIVLGAPTQKHGRFDTERRDAADLRGWAADVFRAGAATVIALPSLDPELAGGVLRDIAFHIAEGITSRAVHNAVRAARTSIGTWTAGGGAGSAERRVEQALDVCLFRRGRMPAEMIAEERG